MSPKRKRVSSKRYQPRVSRKQSLGNYGIDKSRAPLERPWSAAEQARGILAPISRWLTEGLEAHDLKEAKALLELLS